MEGCIFCEVAEKHIPCKFIYENEKTMAFLDINPGAPGHTLVISKKHYDTVFDMPDEEIGEIYKTVSKMVKAINKVMKPDGVNVFQNNKAAAGQIINHVHVHIFPRFHGDGIDFKWRRVVLDSEDLDNIAARISKGVE